MGDLVSEAKLIASRFKKKTKQTTLAKVVLSEAVWHIWKEEMRGYSRKRDTR